MSRAEFIFDNQNENLNLVRIRKFKDEKNVITEEEKREEYKRVSKKLVLSFQSISDIP